MGDVVPFLEALSAAGCCGVLGDKYGVVFSWRLPAIIGGGGRC